MKKKVVENENSYISIEVIRIICKVLPLTIDKWIMKFENFSNKQMKPSRSSVSAWMNGMREMEMDYKELIIKILINDTTLLDKEKKIRESIYERFGIQKWYRVFTKLSNMSYEEFLQYMILNPDTKKIHMGEIDWKQVDNAAIMNLLEEKINKSDRRYNINAKWNLERSILLLTYPYYVNGKNKEYTVSIYFCKGNVINRFCKENIWRDEDNVLSIIFVTKDVKNKEYLDILRQYSTMLISVDAFDLQGIDKYSSYVRNNKWTETQEVFFNKMAEFMLKRILEQNYIVLKEILSRNYNKDNLGERYFVSNAGVWEYKYPVRCALDFEKNLIINVAKDIIKKKLAAEVAKDEMKDNSIQETAKDGTRKPNPLRILDINLTGGMYGLRLNRFAKQVTCVDTTPGCLKKIEEIIKGYNNGILETEIEIANVITGYIRPDNFTVLKGTTKNKQYELIILGLGSASFIDNLSSFLRRISSLLTDDGKIVISVYNRNALCKNSLNIENMDFIYEEDNVHYRDASWGLYAKNYTCQDIRDIVSKQHVIEKMYSYPTISSVVSNQQDSRILDNLRKIDIYYAENAESTTTNGQGMYNIVCASKLDQKGIIQCFNDAQLYIRNQEIDVTEIDHQEIYSRQAMYKLLRDKNIILNKNFVKSVLVYDKRNRICFWVFLWLEDSFDKNFLISWYEKNNTEHEFSVKHIKLYREYQLSELKLASGSISPFAYPSVKEIIENERKEKIILLYNKEIEKSTERYLYSYSGNLRKTLKMKKSSFIKYIKKQDGLYYS